YAHLVNTFASLRHLLHLCLCCSPFALICLSFFFNDTAPPDIYTLSLHDALPISASLVGDRADRIKVGLDRRVAMGLTGPIDLGIDRKSTRLKLQSHLNLVCRLLLEKKKKKTYLR